MLNRRVSLALSAALILGLSGACKKKVPPPPPPPPPAEAPAAAAKPVINYFTAEPSTVNSGQPSSLRWSVTDATTVTLDNGIGTVSPNGRRGVSPTATTTYHLTATGTGGTSEGDATVTVSTPPPPVPVGPSTPAQTVQDILAHQVQDIHFDYDKSDVRSDDQAVLQSDAAALKQIFQMDASFIVTVEGHCDERGSAEYNIGLGDRRAAAPQAGPLTLRAAPGDPGQTCIALEDARRPQVAALIRRCTYGIVRMASIQFIAQGPALLLAVQPLEGWRELWIFHQATGSWTIDVLSPVGGSQHGALRRDEHPRVGVVAGIVQRVDQVAPVSVRFTTLNMDPPRSVR